MLVHEMKDRLRDGERTYLFRHEYIADVDGSDHRILTHGNVDRIEFDALVFIC